MFDVRWNFYRTVGQWIFEVNHLYDGCPFTVALCTTTSDRMRRTIHYTITFDYFVSSLFFFRSCCVERTYRRMDSRLLMCELYALHVLVHYFDVIGIVVSQGFLTIHRNFIEMMTGDLDETIKTSTEVSTWHTKCRSERVRWQRLRRHYLLTGPFLRFHRRGEKTKHVIMELCARTFQADDVRTFEICIRETSYTYSAGHWRRNFQIVRTKISWTNR